MSNEEPTPDQPEPETEEPTTPTGPAHSEGTGEVVNPEDKEQ